MEATPGSLPVGRTEGASGVAPADAGTEIGAWLMSDDARDPVRHPNRSEGPDPSPPQV
ncbi:hypothetical protein Acsp06_48980 [Actinomycetospora sp. NBRC 106375]|nr:hypothetical protein Acsp06_48980 [Actinomycetospora sp. NBRC 106375]